MSQRIRLISAVSKTKAASLVCASGDYFDLPQCWASPFFMTKKVSKKSLFAFGLKPTILGLLPRGH